MMTKTDYQTIANGVYCASRHLPPAARLDNANTVASTLVGTNWRFNRYRFIRACYLGHDFDNAKTRKEPETLEFLSEYEAWTISRNGRTTLKAAA